jgi:signal transduction histidine kinase/AmiR/NasT family two-component response regulator
MPTGPTPGLVPRFERSPRWSAVLAASALFLCALASMATLNRVARRAADDALANELSVLVQIASLELDVPAHAQLQRADQLNGRDYERVVAPLRTLVGAAHSVRFIYTTRKVGERIEFVADAAFPIDQDADGVLDQAALGEVYDDAPDALRRAFDTGAPQVATKPYADRWGEFVAAFAPLFDASGRLECVLAVEYDARAHAARLESMDFAALCGTGIAALASAVLGILVYLVQRERKRVRDELDLALRRAESASLAKSEFLANMSHEIRTPMTSILGYSEILRDDFGETRGSPLQVEALDVIARNGRHLLAVINDILDISKLETGRMELARVPTTPAQLLHDVVTTLQPRALERGLEFDVRIADNLPRRVLSDPLRLRQIVVNLLGNAIKFTERGSVTLEARFDAERRRIEIEVRDTGIGMTPEQLARVFQPFEQADGSMSRRYGGTGLGLPISRKLAERLGGALHARSELGAGSTFTLELPAVENEPAAALPARTARVRGAPLGTLDMGSLDGLRVLLVEDSAVNRRLIARMLERAGALVTQAENGRDAVEALSVDGDFEKAPIEPPPFDVVLMDMQMPVLDGYSAVRLLRNRGASVSIIALTAHALTADRAACIEAGCDEYATKPIEQRDLIAACRGAVERNAALRRELA